MYIRFEKIHICLNRGRYITCLTKTIDIFFCTKRINSTCFTLYKLFKSFFLFSFVRWMTWHRAALCPNPIFKKFYHETCFPQEKIYKIIRNLIYLISDYRKYRKVNTAIMRLWMVPVYIKQWTLERTIQSCLSYYNVLTCIKFFLL